MKSLLSFFAVITLSVSNCAYSQFKTEYNSNGDPLTEILDESMMKQGDWLYYNQDEQLIRKEHYTDNQLSASSIIKDANKTPIDASHYQLVEVSNSSLGTEGHGEIIFQNGELLVAYFYLGSAKSTKSIEAIQQELEKSYPHPDNVIFIF